MSTDQENFTSHVSALKNAFSNLLEAKKVLDGCRERLSTFLKENPPKTFRLQEAERNINAGIMTPPHWDEVFPYENHSAIDQDELIGHIMNLGEWTTVYDSETDPTTEGLRRVIDLTW